jgi:hypothetical protein
MLGQNEISVALGGPDKQTREQRRSQLTVALMTDLRSLDDVILIFDTFEQCDPSLQPWFASVFLPAIHRSSQLSVIVAGRSTPEPTQMWDAEILPLNGIAPKHWLEYAQVVGASLNLDYIRGCCDALKGNCLAIAQTIESRGGHA